MDEDYFATLRRINWEEKQAYLAANPDFVPDGDFWDAHSCSMFANAWGYCDWCGSLVYSDDDY